MIFTEPKNGVPFTTETFSPTHANNVVDSERRIFYSLISSWRECTIPASVIGGVATDINVFWSNRAQCWLFKSGSALGALNAFGRALETGSTAALTSSYTCLTSYESATGIQLEAYPYPGATDVLASTDFGVTWTTLISSAALSGYAHDGTSRAAWLGGPTNVRLVPLRDVATGNTPAILVRSGASSATVVALPGGATGSQQMSIAHNGSGVAIMVGNYDSLVRLCSGYGVAAGNWTTSILPAGYFASAVSTADYDDEAGVFVVLQRTWGGTTPSALQFTTSSDGSAWQAWRTLPFTWGRSLSGAEPRIRCVGGVWFVLNAEPVNAASTTTDAFRYVIWFSCDRGASWRRAGQLGSIKNLSTADGGGDYFADIEKTSDGRLLVLCTEGTGGLGTATAAVLGPFTTPTALAST